MLRAVAVAALAAALLAPAAGARVDVAAAEQLLGRSQEWRPIHAHRLGDRDAERTLLVVGCIHGNECEGMGVTRLLLRHRGGVAVDLWVVPNLNPDGLARRTRQNGRGVDLNRNFPVGWRPHGRPWAPEHSGARPFSEREARIVRNLIERIRPDVTVWYHQPQAVVRDQGPRTGAARRYARAAGERFRVLPAPPGAATSWQLRRFPRSEAFVVELPPGPLSDADARRHLRGLLALSG